MIVIYGLIDPRTNEIRYIGKTKNVTDRMYDHIGKARKGGREHRSKWIRILLSEGLLPLTTVLEECSADSDWQMLERKWIAYGHENGWPLTNETNGGEGAQLSPDAIERMRQSKIGTPAWNRGTKTPKETRIKQSKARKGKTPWNKGKRYKNPEHSERMRGRPSPKKGVPMSDEQRETMSKAHTGIALSEHHRQRQSEGQRKRRERERLERLANNVQA